MLQTQTGNDHTSAAIVAMRDPSLAQIHGQMMKTKSMKEYLSKELIWDTGIASLVRDCEEEICLRK